MSFERCHKRTHLRVGSTFFRIVLLILFVNENRLLVSCQSDVSPSDMVGSATGFDIQGLLGTGVDSVRGFLTRNHQWFVPLVAGGVPAKLATFMTLRALRQQSNDDERQRQRVILNGLRGVDPDGDDNEQDDNDRGPPGEEEEDQDKKDSTMLFVGDGNIQVKNGKDEEESDKDFTYQKIDLEKKFMNKNMDRIDDRVDEDIKRVWRKVRKNKSKSKKKKRRRQKSGQNFRKPRISK